MTTLRNKLIEQILNLVQEADVVISQPPEGNGVDYKVELDRRLAEFVLKHDLPELDALLTKYDE